MKWKSSGMSENKDKKGKKEASINKIIEATMRLVNKKGYIKVATNHIAKEAGISIGLLYKYFPEGKPAIFSEIARRSSAEILGTVNLKELTEQNLPKILKPFLLEYIKRHRETASLVTAMEMAFLSNKEVFRNYEEIFTVKLNIIPLISQILVKIGFSNARNLEELSKMIFHTLDCLVHRHVIFSYLVESDEVLVDYLIDLILGFLTRKLK
jgi:AcrR family transcriptional regulator